MTKVGTVTKARLKLLLQSLLLVYIKKKMGGNRVKMTTKPYGYPAKITGKNNFLAV